MFEPCLKFTTVDQFGGMRTSNTNYIRGCNLRNESLNCSGRSDPHQPSTVIWEYGPLRAYIKNRELGRDFIMDLDARIYTAHRVNKVRRGLKLKKSGFVTQIESETIDTGERREMFGYMARHMISRQTTTPDPASGQEPHESEIDGWYIDPPAAWMKLHPAKPGARCFVSAHVRGRGVNELKVSHTGPNETGFPLTTTCISRSGFRDSDGSLREHQSMHRSEVTEFSEADLDPALFLPPRDFRRVLQLPE